MYGKDLTQTHITTFTRAPIAADFKEYIQTYRWGHPFSYFWASG